MLLMISSPDDGVAAPKLNTDRLENEYTKAGVRLADGTFAVAVF